ncbi:two-component sensor histidine kinase [Virgisporangium aliadipatigenens]|uniref:histidine kinase n=1 Tax=Virgisporangium aliadipatigenens TaxID=741659 RepID=A0A8J3YI42_9ACTN|nr:HAMP domain-containing sensor histidine kinase [Virgisporangium aliadipatigenens]GIJ44363.1 two-component sensor histidine kinase [Virgisporangium aliadipatigenens]
MNLGTPRRRMLAVCMITLGLGYLLRMFAYSIPQTPTTVRLLDGICPRDASVVGPLCERVQDEGFWVVPFLAALLGGAVLMFAVLPWLVAWALRPVHDLVPMVDQLGPQNLGHRLQILGGDDDEFAELCRAVDEMLDRLQAGYEGQRRFAANASHELRTPLAVQRTLVEVGMTEHLTEEQRALLTSQLLRTNERNERLVEGLLVLSEADQGLAVRLPVRLDEIAARVMSTHRGRAEDAQIELTASLRPRVVQGEDVLLERLLTNLVQNAIKYNYKGGEVHVAVGRAPALVVVNTGEPVPPDAVDELFEPFKRLGGDRIDHSGGAGLGLAIVRSIVRAHGGTVSASAPDTGGLRIEVHLPDGGPD